MYNAEIRAEKLIFATASDDRVRPVLSATALSGETAQRGLAAVPAARDGSGSAARRPRPEDRGARGEMVDARLVLAAVLLAGLDLEHMCAVTHAAISRRAAGRRSPRVRSATPCGLTQGVLTVRVLSRSWPDESGG